MVLPLLPAAYARLAEEKTAGWRSACDSERQKAREFLQANNVPKTDLREPLPPHPREPQMSISSLLALATPDPSKLFDVTIDQAHLVDEILPRLSTILHGRGTLCSHAAPCTIMRAPGRTKHAHQTRSPKQAPGTFSICLPPTKRPRTVCEVAPARREAAPSGFVLRKACSLGTQRRCFNFSASDMVRYAAIARLRASLLRDDRKLIATNKSLLHPFVFDAKVRKLGRVPVALKRSLGRCAVVMPGHSLRCGLREWAELIDSSYYDAVFRCGTYPKPGSTSSRLAGTRTDYAYRGCGKAPATAFCLGPSDCERLKGTESSTSPAQQRRATKACIDPRNGRGWVGCCRQPSWLAAAGLRPASWVASASLRPAASGFDDNIQRACGHSRFCKAFDESGLGWAHSGGFVLDHATALCERVDVYGMGMFAAGGDGTSDVTYQYHHSPRFAVSCSGHPCVASTNASAESFLRKSKVAAALCQPQEDCKARSSHLVDDAGRALLSEGPEDFFYRSELRLAVLHAFGMINWVWY